MEQLSLFGEKIEEGLKLKKDNGKIITNAPCGPTPPGEIVLRSAFCNLKCIPCFAYNYSWPEKARENKEVVDVSVDRLLDEFITFLNEKPIPGNKTFYNWFRILGGEPFLNRKSLEDYVKVLIKIPDDISLKFNNSILIQTNGVILGSYFPDEKDKLREIFDPIRHKPFKVVIEISIKGSNCEEFRIVTQTSERAAKKLHEEHLKACQAMKYVHHHISNIDWTAVAGFGIGVTNLVNRNFESKGYIKTFYHPKTNLPFYHPKCWDDHFESIYEFHVEKYRNKFGNLFPMFGIEDRRRWKFGLHGLKNCKEYAKEYFYDGYNVYKKKIGECNEELEQYLNDILEKFFFGDPTHYYSRLFE